LNLYNICIYFYTVSLLGLGFLLACFLHKSLDIALFFNHEGADDALTNTTSTLVSAIGTSNSLLSLRNASIMGGTKVRNTSQSTTTATTLGSLSDLSAVVNSEASTRGSDYTGLVGSGGVGMTITMGNTLNHSRCEEERKDYYSCLWRKPMWRLCS